MLTDGHTTQTSPARGMGRWRSGGLGLIASGVVATSALAVATGTAGAQPSQRPPAAARKPVSCLRERAVKRSGEAIIYATRTSLTDAGGNALTAYAACRRPSGRSAVIGYSASEGGEYAPDDVLKQLVIAGNYAGTLVEVGDGSREACTKYEGDTPLCPKPADDVTFADVDPLATAGSISAPEGSSGLVISSAGAAAWLSPAPAATMPTVTTPSGTATTTTTGTTTTPVTPSGEQLTVAALVPSGRKLIITRHVLATGSVSDVRITGLTVSWSQDGLTHTAVVRRTVH